MTKYRLRLSNGRVIGPFSKEEVFDIKSKGHLRGDEEFQVFPTGNWGALSGIEFYQELMDENRTTVLSEKKEETFVLDLSKIRNQKNSKEIERIDLTHHQPIESLTETVRIKQETKEMKKAEPKEELDPKLKKELVDIELDHGDREDKTQINPIAQKEIEKMRTAQKLAEEEKRKKEEQEKAKKQEEIEEQQKNNVPKVIDESTQMINLDTVQESLLEVAKNEEKRFEIEEKKIKKKIKEEEENEDNEEEDDEENTKSGSKKRILLIVAAALIIYAVLFPEDESKKPKPFQVIAPEIIFPIPFDKADKKKALVEFKKGKELFDMGTYPELVKAGIHFKNAYENDIDNVEIIGYMVRTYAEELKYSKDKSLDGQTLFNIILAKKPFLIREPNGVIGLSLFYNSIGKNDAAVDVIKKFLKLNDKPTEDLFAYNVKFLLKAGKLDLARKQFIAALLKQENKSRYTLEALIEYSMLNQELDEMDTYIDDGLKRFPKIVKFILWRAQRLYEEKKFAEMEPYLKKAEELTLENNDIERAKFLELRGLIEANKGNIKEASAVLKRSLELNDSDSLRQKLAALSITNGRDKGTDNLIEESKAIKYLSEAKEFYQNRTFQNALVSAIKAVDVYPDYIPSSIFLAKVQHRLGLAEQALKTLTTLNKKFPDNKEVVFGLLELYIDCYKFNDAKNLIVFIAGSPLKNNYEYYSLNARLYMKMGDSLQAISWLKTSTSVNPLNDRDLFLLSELLIKRANFDAARSLLNKCIELDPINADYRIAYSKILYELQDDQAAIGYLLNLLEEFGENTKILSEIAIFYYRAGKIKDFMDFKVRIEKLPNKDRALYDFLIRMALLDERYDEIPKLVEELIKIEPGDLESMMTAGKVLFENNKLVEAAHWFVRVKNKLPTYPKVQYFVAKMKLLAGEIEDPKDENGKPKIDANGEPMKGALSTILDDLKSNGENDLGLVLLAEIYVKQDKLVEAENTFKKAQRLNPRSYDALMGIADISTKRNNFDLALDLYKKAMKERSDDPKIHKKIGDVYRLLGQGSLAMEEYKMYLQMDPDASDKGQIEAYIKIMQ